MVYKKKYYKKKAKKLYYKANREAILKKRKEYRQSILNGTHKPKQRVLDSK